MTSPKILQSCLSKSWGGLEMVAFENALAFAKNKIECHTLCLQNSPLEEHLRKAGLPTLSIAHNGFFEFLKVRRFLLAHGIKTILVQALKDLRVLALVLIRVRGIKIFAISHTFVNVNKKDFLHRWVYQNVQKLICLTDLHRENLLQHLPLKDSQLAVLPNYVDCEKFKPENRDETTRKEFGAREGVLLLGVASRLDPQKGQDDALRAMALLKGQNIPVRLVIVGENTRNEMNYLAVLKNLSQELGLNESVYFTGYRGDMERVMASLDGLMMPSHCETFGRVLIEAMASKTPVIATNAGGVPNIIDADRTGLLVPPKDPQGIAEAIRRFASEGSLRERLQEEAYQKVKTTYAREVVEKRLLQLLELVPATPPL